MWPDQDNILIIHFLDKNKPHYQGLDVNPKYQRAKFYEMFFQLSTYFLNTLFS